jgi:hypothetical protein
LNVIRLQVRRETLVPLTWFHQTHQDVDSPRDFLHGDPVAGLTQVLGSDRFMFEARALTNVIGNGVATLVIAQWTGELDAVTMHRELAASEGIVIPKEA